MDGQLDVHYINMLEQKLEKSRFVRVDSDIIDNLIQKEDAKEVTLTDKQKEGLNEAFTSQLPKLDKVNFSVDYKALGQSAQPIQITQNEVMRRMKDASAMQPGMSFYGDMPDNYNLVLNVDNPLISKIISEVDGKEKEDVVKYASENQNIRQLIDLSLLSNGMLKGESLNNFIKRSNDLIK